MTERELLTEVKCSNYQGIYDSENGRTQYDWGKYDYSVSKEQQEPDYIELCRAARVLTDKSNTHVAVAEYGDKYNSVYVYTYKAVVENKELYEKIASNKKELLAKINAAGFFNKEIDDKISAELKAKKALDRTVKAISKKLGFEVTPEQYKSVQKLVNNPRPMNYGFDIKLSNTWNYKTFDNVVDLFNFLNSDRFITDLINDGQNICKATVYLKTDYINIELRKSNGYEQSVYLSGGFIVKDKQINHRIVLAEILVKFTTLYLSLSKTSK